eukprot:5818511-Pyramimonas_sp.AAC.1
MLSSPPETNITTPLPIAATGLVTKEELVGFWTVRVVERNGPSTVMAALTNMFAYASCNMSECTQ